MSVATAVTWPKKPAQGTSRTQINFDTRLARAVNEWFRVNDMVLGAISGMIIARDKVIPLCLMTWPGMVAYQGVTSIVSDGIRMFVFLEEQDFAQQLLLRTEEQFTCWIENGGLHRAPLWARAPSIPNDVMLVRKNEDTNQEEVFSHLYSRWILLKTYHSIELKPHSLLDFRNAGTTGILRAKAYELANAIGAAPPTIEECCLLIREATGMPEPFNWHEFILFGGR